MRHENKYNLDWAFDSELCSTLLCHVIGEPCSSRLRTFMVAILPCSSSIHTEDIVTLTRLVSAAFAAPDVIHWAPGIFFSNRISLVFMSSPDHQKACRKPQDDCEASLLWGT